MTRKVFNGDPIPLQKRSRIEEIMYQRINKSAFAMGYAMGVARRRVLKNLSLFDMMSSMSKGMDAAAGRKE